jgi:tRNA(fMet)-specific endonuclease VapC
MDRALLDTDTLSEVLKGRNPEVTARAKAYRAVFGRYTVSLVSVVEVVKGFQRRTQETALKRFLARIPAMELLTLDLASAELAGRIYGDLERTGQTIGRMDPLIAGIAISNGLVLVTGNQAHYRRIRALGYDLELDNWRPTTSGTTTASGT